MSPAGPILPAPSSPARATRRPVRRGRPTQASKARDLVCEWFNHSGGELRSTSQATVEVATVYLFIYTSLLSSAPRLARERPRRAQGTSPFAQSRMPPSSATLFTKRLDIPLSISRWFRRPCARLPRSSAVAPHYVGLRAESSQLSQLITCLLHTRL